MAWDHSKLALNQTGLYTALCELPEGFYNPQFDLAGKTVLDVGATNGEVAYWFIQRYHAAKVICIENDPASLPLLRKNAQLMNVDVVDEAFSVEHLRKFQYDFVKCDVEGYEMLLLEFVEQGGVLPPTVVEVHTNWVKDQFLKAGFKIVKVVNDTRVQIAVYLMNNYACFGREKT